VLLQSREQQLLDFIETFQAASASQLQQLFYTGMKPDSARKKAQARLKMLHDNGYLKRARSDLNSEYIYFQKKTQFIQHQLLLVDVYLVFSRMKGKLIEFSPEVVMGDIRPDAKIIFDDGQLTHFILVEIHRSNTFNQEKYEQFYLTKAWKLYFPVFPKILIVSNKRITLQSTKLPYYHVSNSLKGIEKILSSKQEKLETCRNMR
jgi:hypothetical protein